MRDVTPDQLSDALRRAIVESGTPFLTLEQRTGVARASITRFVSGKRSMRLDMAGRLAAYFGLELRPKRKKR
jgi:plasmid maintenance system antidote protein VapI